MGVSSIYEDDIKKSRMILMIFHHLVFDWDSIYLLHNQFRDVMKHLSQGPPLSEVGKYSDYVYNMQSKLTEEKQQKIHDYWQQELAENLESVFRPNNSFKSDEMGVYIFELSDIQRKSLKKMAKEYRCSEFLILFAIIGLTIKSITNKTNFIINTPYSNRYLTCKKPTIGVMLYSIVIKFGSESLKSLEKCVLNLKKNLAKAFDHQPVNLNYLQKLIRKNKNDLQLYYNHQFYQSTSVSVNSSNIGTRIIPLFRNRDLTKSISPFAMETFANDQGITIRISHQKRYVKETFLNSFKNVFLSYLGST